MFSWLRLGLGLESGKMETVISQREYRNPVLSFLNYGKAKGSQGLTEAGKQHGKLRKYEEQRHGWVQVQEAQPSSRPLAAVGHVGSVGERPPGARQRLRSSTWPRTNTSFWNRPSQQASLGDFLFF